MEALGQLTGGIAHDFNNLLTVVVGGLDLIAKQVEDERLKRYADNALTAAERGARLTAQLLAFSRVQRLEVKPTHVAPLIENMRPLLRNVLGPGIDKHFDARRGADAGDGRPDPARARGAQPGDQRARRDARRRRCSPSPPAALRFTGDPELEDGDYVELAVSDTGTGMPPEVAARAFEPFFTTKEVGKGTGLGLSMVYGVARQSGGTARIDSAPGEGTTVRLYFRRADVRGRSPKPTASRPRLASRPSASASILVIDDDPDVRDFIAASLADYGYRCARRPTAHAGLDAVRRRSGPTWSILDFAMPGTVGRRGRGADPASRSRASRSCSCPAIARPRRSAAPRPTRRCSPSRSAPTRSTPRCARRSAGNKRRDGR